MTKEEIKAWLDQNSNKCSFKLNPDNSVVLLGSLSITESNIEKIPFKIDKALDNLYASTAGLKTLENFPEFVNGNLHISYNNLTTLEHCPEQINGSFSISGNPLKNFEHLPKQVYGKILMERIDIQDPYAYRYFLYVKHNGLVIGDEDYDPYIGEILRIVSKYTNKPTMYHLAIEELMNFGEKHGFTY